MAGLKANLDKWEFEKRAIEYIRFNVSRDDKVVLKKRLNT
jgi:hypothetical protein